MPLVGRVYLGKKYHFAIKLLITAYGHSSLVLTAIFFFHCSKCGHQEPNSCKSIRQAANHQIQPLNTKQLSLTSSRMQLTLSVLWNCVSILTKVANLCLANMFQFVYLFIHNDCWLFEIFKKVDRLLIDRRSIIWSVS